MMKDVDGAMLTPEQTAIAEGLKARGGYRTVQAVVSDALTLLQTAMLDPERDRQALKRLLQARLDGPFQSAEDFEAALDAVIDRELSDAPDL